MNPYPNHEPIQSGTDRPRTTNSKPTRTRPIQASSAVHSFVRVRLRRDPSFAGRPTSPRSRARQRSGGKRAVSAWDSSPACARLAPPLHRLSPPINSAHRTTSSPRALVFLSSPRCPSPSASPLLSLSCPSSPRRGRHPSLGRGPRRARVLRHFLLYILRFDFEAGRLLLHRLICSAALRLRALADPLGPSRLRATPAAS